MSWGAEDKEALGDQFWKKTKKDSAVRGKPGFGPQVPTPAWWGAGTGIKAPRGRGIAGLTTAQFDEPMEPNDDCPAKAVIEKRMSPDMDGKCQYLVDWNDPERDDSWEDRDELIKNWPMRGAINQFEGLLLDEIKSVLFKEIERHREKVPLVSLSEKLKSEYPFFKWNHLPMQLRVVCRNVASLCRTLDDKWVVRPGRGSGGGFIMTEEQAKQEEVKAEAKKKTLKKSYAKLLDVIRWYGKPIELTFVNQVFMQKNPMFDFADYGFGQFKEFILSCPGVKTCPPPPGAASGFGLIVELVDENPDELKDVLKEKEREEPHRKISASQLPSMGGRPAAFAPPAKISLGINFGARAKEEFRAPARRPSRSRSRNRGYRRDARPRRPRSRSRDRRRRRSRERDRRKKRRSPSPSSRSSSPSSSAAKRKKKRKDKKKRNRSSSSDSSGGLAGR